MFDEQLPQGVEEGAISLVLGHPDPETLPVDDLLPATQAVLRGSKARLALQYGPEQGTPELIDYLVEKLNREEELNLTYDNMMIVAGSTHAIDMIARLFVGAGGAVLVESPTYKDAIRVFQDHRVDVHGVAIDNEGIIVDALAAKLRELRDAGVQPRLLYTIPNFQNPTGVTLTIARRGAILDLAREYGFMIVEDDVYRDLVFEDDVPPSFYALAEGANVLRISSFSKIMAPGLRLGWLIAAPEHIRRCVECGATEMGGGANPFVAHMVAKYCRVGQLEPHIKRLRKVYQHRRDVTLGALRRYMPDDVTWTRPRGGFFIWLTLPEGVETARVQEMARERGVLFAAGAGFYVGGGGERNLRLAFSFAASEDIESGIRVLGEVVGAARRVSSNMVL